jgi:hypothetical protein
MEEENTLELKREKRKLVEYVQKMQSLERVKEAYSYFKMKEKEEIKDSFFENKENIKAIKEGIKELEEGQYTIRTAKEAQEYFDL